MKLLFKICIVFFSMTFASSAFAYYQQGIHSNPYTSRSVMPGYYSPNGHFYNNPHHRMYPYSHYRHRYSNIYYDRIRAEERYNNRYNYDRKTDTPVFQVVPGVPVAPIQRNDGICVKR